MVQGVGSATDHKRNNGVDVFYAVPCSEGNLFLTLVMSWFLSLYSLQCGECSFKKISSE